MRKTAPLPAIPRRRWSWPDWPVGLFEDSDGIHHYDGDTLDRATFDECARAVGEFNRPALLSDLVSDGSLELGSPAMAGVIARVWSTSEFAESALTRPHWVQLFRANGFSVNGQHRQSPAEPIRLFRSCVPMILYFDTNRRLISPDINGRPAVTNGEVFEAWDTRRGMSWTSDGQLAQRFARKHGESVFAATVEPKYLLAQIGTDFVVDPAGLTDVASIEIAAVQP